MRIIGIDPGMAIVGYSILDIDKQGALTLVSSGSIQTSSKEPESKRLLEIYNDLKTIINKFKPDAASVEKLFFFKNKKTVMPVSQARGVIVMALEQAGLVIYEFTPIEIKQSLTGYGRATKDEVAKLVKVCLNNCKLPKLDDTVDSIAIAICCARSINLKTMQQLQEEK